MRSFMCAIMCLGTLATASSLAAQPPGQGRGNTAKAAGANDLVTQMMAFDANKDGQLTRSEVTDERLLRLFDRADADKNGTVTKSELNALQVRERAASRGRMGGFGGPGGPGGFGRPRRTGRLRRTWRPTPTRPDPARNAPPAPVADRRPGKAS